MHDALETEMPPSMIPAPHIPTSASADPAMPPLYVWQRCFDLMVAVPAMIAAFPVILMAGLLVKLTSQGTIFYSQIRAGANGRPFRILKLRTMRMNCEAESGACWSTTGDPRITPVGRWLRKLHIDELPQLFNVLRGEMSIVGPRPERPEIIDDLVCDIPFYAERLIVRPGITGLAQIQQPPDVTPDCVRRKLLYDRHAIRHRSLSFDVRVVFGTVIYLLGASYANVRRFSGLTAPAMPDDVVMFRINPDADCREGAFPLLDSPPGIAGS
jgi:lipopolysaccharide/colanic/teichoic acid biosynthesis glycosyltransferase